MRFKLDPGTHSVTAEDVVRAMRTLLGAAGDLRDWTIRRMSLASPFVIEASCRDEIQKPYAVFVKKMNALAQGKIPRVGFIGVQAKLLDSMDFVTGGAFGSIEIAPPGNKPITLNKNAIEQARQTTGQLLPSLMIHAKQQMGQLRGYLEQITVRRGQQPRFVIRDRVSGDVVACLLSDEYARLVDVAAKAIGKRVTITGLVSYNDKSRPTSIKAASIEPIEEYIIPFDSLPRVPLTNDGKSVEYIRRLRDA
ncbi:MAG TPA: hypothetical protein VFE58_04435 [Tepidisphaeraceae bacterium]|jgi:hypothetical protein|nr:hypothetical protein [Tepidisphaeraceae bacterium]